LTSSSISNTSNSASVSDSSLPPSILWRAS
jgi:hypothetical protein